MEITIYLITGLAGVVIGWLLSKSKSNSTLLNEKERLKGEIHSLTARYKATCETIDVQKYQLVALENERNNLREESVQIGKQLATEIANNEIADEKLLKPKRNLKEIEENERHVLSQAIKKARMPELIGLDENVVPISENVLKRILERESDKGYIIISAFRIDKAPEENLENNYSLMNDIAINGFNFIKIFGGFREKSEDQPSKAVKVLFFLVPNIAKGTIKKYDSTANLRKAAIELCNKFDQQGALFKDTGETPPVYISKFGGINVVLTNKISLGNISHEYFKGIEKTSAGRLTYTNELFLMKTPGTLFGRHARSGEIFISGNSSLFC